MKKILALLALMGVAHAEPPNFVFILVDDMSWVGTSAEMIAGDDESKSDYYQTPNIDRLAEQGMRFSNAYAPASLCTPSRAAILTGKTPAELNMTTPGPVESPETYQQLIAPSHISEFPKSETTIAEVLRVQGYTTAHFGKWHLGRVSPGEHGFDEHDGATGNASGGTDENPKDIFGVTERAIEFLEEHKKEPFYLQLSHYAVHVPFQALEKSKEKFSKVRKGERQSDVDLAGMTWDLDTSVGTLLKKIDELGLAENTVVVFMSDNGGGATPRSSQNLPLNGGKGTLYEGGIRVPLIVRGPGIDGDTFCAEPVTGCDLFPTFSEWAGCQNVEDVEGASLIPLLTGEGDFERPESSLLFYYPHYGQGPAQKPQSAIIDGGLKLLKDLETESVQLFDLDADLSEQKDLSRKMPEKTEQLDQLLRRRLEELDAQLPEENPDYDPAASSNSRRRRR